jgi:hypothetical protein
MIHRYRTENVNTSRSYNKWLPEEDTKLIQEIIDDKTFEEIALEHKRTVLAIKSRVYWYKENRSRST